MANFEFSRDFYVFAGYVNKKFSKIKLTKAIFGVVIVCFPVTEFSGDYVLVFRSLWFHYFFRGSFRGYFRGE